MKTFWHDLVVQTTENNLAELDPKLAQFVERHHFFYLRDLTQTFQALVTESGIRDGLFTAQSMHTTAVLSLNELDEPMLVMDLLRTLETLAPKVNDYLHNSKLRTKNLCAEDNKCDRNADAHIKAFLSGGPTASALVRHGELVLGRWQRFAFIDYDGPRDRRITIQIIGE
ncbi:MAG: YjbQ family protein [Deltaproteobacteria bacterium]|nr:YjbQ family protein [Deltaproteobacteria bacterium]